MQDYGHWLVAAGVGLLLSVAPALAEPLTLEAVRHSDLGHWQGKLEYRDYQADRWYALPFTTNITDGGDGVTQIRTADFDDGPKSAPKAKIVRITTVTMLGKDGTTMYAVSFRKGDLPEVSTSTMALDPASTDARHWTVIETERGRDDNRPAEIRITSRRDGDTQTSLKEVRFTDGNAVDKKVDTQSKAAAGWIVRNRMTLTVIP